MRNRPHPLFVGYFVIGFLLLLASILIVIGNYNFKTNRYILFFNNAVTGLQKGATVNYRGVKVGTVIEVYATLDGEDIRNKDISIPVIIEIDTDHFKMVSEDTDYNFDETLEQYIEDGLRAQLEIQSFLTGLLQIELDFYPETPINLSHRVFEYKEIPTIPSNFQMFTKELQKVNIKEVVNKFTSMTESIDKAAQEFTKTAEEINKRLPDIADNVDSATKELKGMAENAKRLTNENSETLRNFNQTLESVNYAAQSVKELSDNMNARPNSLIFGKGDKK